jgi:V-type H+-transporting ATPase subunit a
MGDMFRSEKMALAQLFIQPEAAYFAISELGESGNVQFRDLNENVNTFQRKFVNEVRRCGEMERKLRYIETEVKKDKVSIPDVQELPKAPNPREIIDLEAHLEKTEGDIKELSESAINLKSNYLELTELKLVLEKTQTFFNGQNEANGLDSAYKALIAEDLSNLTIEGHLGFVAGVINRERVPGFERMLWRISRGNIFLRQVEIDEPLEDPATGHEIYKTVFVAFFQGDELQNRIKKICAGYHASLYVCPSSLPQRNEMLKGVSTRLEDLNLVLNQTQDHRQRVLVSVAKELQNWSIMVSKMKAIYHTLNFFNMDVTKKCLIGECWVPTKNIPAVQKALSDGASACGSSIPSFLNVINTSEDPPTFNRTNKFTRGFQNLIDSYGVASYREANPALYTIITFPFLFAVMFGDVGHAIVLVCFGGYLVIAEKKFMGKKSSSEIFNIFFAGRYIILLMGIFSMYTGFVYNDIFSKSMNIFGTRWSVNMNKSQALKNELVDLNPSFDYAGTPYFIGVDPVWQLAKNKIVFLNSFKMKLSIIFGVSHMIFGVCVSIINFVHFRKYSSIILEFVPQILLLCFLFLWMVVMMFMKWIMYSAVTREMGNEVKFGSSCAPLVLIYFIDMMLFKQPDEVKNCEKYMFEGQQELQYALVFGALACIPVMLLAKPIFIQCTRRMKPNVRSNGDVNQAVEFEENLESEQKAPLPHHAEEEEPMSEIYIHQAIHTIEYVLSTVSHTASYLRLWALSLAHAQLSEVLWNMLFSMGLKIDGYVGAITTWALFAAWAGFTIAILVTMEGLSAFLHTLRLHWVEFMSKFYVGLGYPFQPFSFKTLLEEEIRPEN